MKDENKKQVMKHLSYVVMLSLMAWSMDTAMAEDTAPTPVVAPADTDADIGKADPALDTERVKQLATTYGVPEAQVQTMRQTDQMGWGEIKKPVVDFATHRRRLGKDRDPPHGGAGDDPDSGAEKVRHGDWPDRQKS